MKRKLLILTTVIMTVLLCACGGTAAGSGSAGSVSGADAAGQSGSVTPLDGFDNAGFVEVKCTESGTCTFTVNDASKAADVDWEVYILDSQFDDALRYVPQSDYRAYAVISGGGSAEVRSGDYMYIYCSENGFTMDSSDDVTADAELDYSIG